MKLALSQSGLTSLELGQNPNLFRKFLNQKQEHESKKKKNNTIDLKIYFQLSLKSILICDEMMFTKGIRLNFYKNSNRFKLD